jgi:hypothetical protein
VLYSQCLLVPLCRWAARLSRCAWGPLMGREKMMMMMISNWVHWFNLVNQCFPPLPADRPAFSLPVPRLIIPHSTPGNPTTVSCPWSYTLRQPELGSWPFPPKSFQEVVLLIMANITHLLISSSGNRTTWKFLSNAYSFVRDGWRFWILAQMNRCGGMRNHEN